VDLNAGTGLLVWELLRRLPEGGVWALVRTAEEAERLALQAGHLEPVERPVIQVGEAQDLPALVAGDAAPQAIPPKDGPPAGVPSKGVPPKDAPPNDAPPKDAPPKDAPPAADLPLRHGPVVFDAAVGRNVLASSAGPARVLAGLAGVLAPGGQLSLAEAVPALGTRPSELLAADFRESPLGRRLAAAEGEMFRDPKNPGWSWGKEELMDALRQAGFQAQPPQEETQQQERRIQREDLDRWFSFPAAGKAPASYAQRLAGRLNPGELEQLRRAFEEQLAGRTVSWTTVVLYLRARKEVIEIPEIAGGKGVPRRP
jgi:putative ATPase